MKSSWFLIAAPLLLFSCSTHNKVSDNSHKSLYDFESSVLHPDILVYHSEDDSTQVFYQIDVSELLYNRQSVEEPFAARIRLSGEMSVLEQDSARIVHKFEVEHNHVASDSYWATKSITLPCQEGIYTLNLKITDLNRKTSSLALIEIDKTNRLNNQNFIAFENGAPVFGAQTITATELRVECARCKDGDMSIARNDDDIKLPPPPFSDSRVSLPDHNAGMKMSLPLENKSMDINLTKGFYFLSQDPDGKLGMTLSVREEFFPDVMTVDDMIKTVRYITSRTEFEAMTTGDKKRESMERFWIECGGSKEKARKLIEVYYNRVREANLYFSHITPGWQTDRGLIHIVFGNPKKIFRYPGKEVWLYGEEDNMNSLQFTFRKKDSPYTNHHLVLQRDHVYKTNWERAVTSWRNGRIYEN